MDYELIDSGEGEKLERFGEFVLRRPDPQAIWRVERLEDWSKADAVFNNGKWKEKKELPKFWNVKINDLVFKISLSSFKHTGVFPEHVENWKWISSLLQSPVSNLKILNLFGYTGGATLAAAKGGAEVTHVDASKPSVARAKENANLSGLDKAPIRWIVDDAAAFVKREIKRGNKYDGIILDPPSFGRGAKGEVWKIEENLMPLLQSCKEIWNGGFILLNGYAAGYSSDAYAQIVSSVFNIELSKIEKGELYIKEKSERGFVLPAGIFARVIL
jgi:23S rRNA (cytosine1962-C5)-methyltransferase